MRFWLAPVLCFLAIAVSGCGGNAKIVAPRTKPVRGTVFFKDKPAEQVRVVFHPQFDIGPVRFQPSGMTDKSGKFALSTAAPSDGAPLGEYTVTFEKVVIVSERKTGFLETEADAWKGKYSSPAASKFKVRIDAEVDLEPFKLQ